MKILSNINFIKDFNLMIKALNLSYGFDNTIRKIIIKELLELGYIQKKEKKEIIVKTLYKIKTQIVKKIEREFSNKRKKVVTNNNIKKNDNKKNKILTKGVFRNRIESKEGLVYDNIIIKQKGKEIKLHIPIKSNKEKGKRTFEIEKHREKHRVSIKNTYSGEKRNELIKKYINKEMVELILFNLKMKKKEGLF